MASHSVATVIDGRTAAHKLDGAAWGLFFIWVGIAFLLNLDWGMGLLGVGVLMIGKQIARKYMGLPLEMFWIVVGSLFILCGIWALLSVRVSLIPIICIVAGAALLASALAARPAEPKSDKAA